MIVKFTYNNRWIYIGLSDEQLYYTLNLVCILYECKWDVLEPTEILTHSVDWTNFFFQYMTVSLSAVELFRFVVSFGNCVSFVVHFYYYYYYYY